MRKQENNNPGIGKHDMAWNEPGGNGNKDPWGNNNRGNNNQGPPDLDEVFKNLQKKLR